MKIKKKTKIKKFGKKGLKKTKIEKKFTDVMMRLSMTKKQRQTMVQTELLRRVGNGHEIMLKVKRNSYAF